VRRQPGGLVIEGASVARVVTGPRHRGHDHAVLRADDPRRVGLDVHRDRAQIERAPAPAALACVVSRDLPTAAPAAVALPAPRTYRGYDRLGLRIELDPLDYRSLDIEQASPYRLHAHAVPTLLFPALIRRKT